MNPLPEASPSPPRKPPRRYVRLPTILQLENVECGAAALAIVLAYYGRIVPLEELRIQCGVSRDGSKASKILAAAKAHGLDARGKNYTKIESLWGEDMRYPLILWWNYNHFLVLGGFRGGKALLSDPAQGPRTVSVEELEASFSKAVLTFEPGPDFKAEGEKPSLVHALRRRLSGSWSAVLYVLLCGLFLMLPGFLTPAYSRVFVDEFLVGGREDLVTPMLFAIVFTALLSMLLRWVQEYHLLRLETKLAVQMSGRFFEHVLRLPMAYFAQRFAGDVAARVAINDKVAKLLSGKLATTCIDILTLLFYGGLMLLYDPLLTLAVVLLTLVNVAALLAVSRIRSDASRQLMTDRGKLEGTAASGLGMIESLKATGGEGELFARWAGFQAKSLAAEQRLQLWGDLISIAPQFVGTAVVGVVLWLGGTKVMAGEMTVGMLVAFQSLTTFFTRPIANFINLGAILQGIEADLNRLDDVYRYPADPVYRQLGDNPQKSKLRGAVELQRVSFGYSPLDPPLIEAFDLKIEPGKRVALVGMSGSGKSTVARLLAGLLEPTGGEVLIDGRPRRSIARTELTRSIAMVDQDIFLFGGTVGENVALWSTKIDTARIRRACQDAAIAGEVEQRALEYESQVAEGGRNFSGGQRQRLEIARALVGDPSILILDEATSALDPTTEVEIMNRLAQRSCTCVIVAHRLSTIRDCDEIVVLERGKIVQRGTHESMHAVDGPYQRLIADQ
jgi:NHLM bacteriocin system ABC transporter peptidase/ATP-binding protein